MKSNATAGFKNKLAKDGQGSGGAGGAGQSSIIE
jgi:hypothetical protein